MRGRIVSLLFLFFALLVSCVQHGNTQPPVADSLQKTTVTDSFPFSKTVNGTHYSIFYAGDAHLSITSKRPSIADEKSLLCIAGAFTQLDDNSIDGLFIGNGTIVKKSVNHSLGGGIFIHGDSVSIFGTSGGKLLTPAWIDSTVTMNASFFQQIQLVRGDSALRFGKDKKLFQRRAIVIFKDGAIAVVESREHILLQKFADDLVQLGAKDALYTDMGSWDEGWYRETGTGKVKVIGRMRGDTERQSNWVTLHE